MYAVAEKLHDAIVKFDLKHDQRLLIAMVIIHVMRELFSLCD